MRFLTISLSLILGCLVVYPARPRTLDLDSGGLSGVATDGLGASSWADSGAILRGKKVAEAIAAMARELEARGDYQTILVTAPAVIEITPDNIRLRHLHALSLVASGNTETALQVLADYPETSDSSIWGALARAMILRSNGALTEAQNVTKEALEREPENAYAHNLAGTIAFAQDALDRAEAHFGRAVELQPESDTYLANLGAVQRLRGNSGTAMITLQAALQINPNACGARINYAGVLQDTGDLTGAQAELEACLDAEPDNNSAIRQMIQVLIMRRQFEPALGIVTRHADNLPEAKSTQARLALLMGQPDLAETILADTEHGTETDLLSAFAAASRGDLETAARMVTSLQSAMPKRPDFALAALGFSAARGELEKASLLYQTDRPELAAGFAYLRGLGAGTAGEERAMRQRLVEEAPDIPGLALTGFPETQITRLASSPATPWLAVALTYSLTDYHRLAYQTAKRATEIDPDLALAHVLRARTAAELRDTKDMLTSLDKALKLAPTGVAPNLQRGEAAMALGDLPLAIRHFEVVLNLADSSSAALRLGLVAERLGEMAKAEAAYEHLIRITPDSFVGYNQLAWLLAEQERDLDRALELARKADTLMPENASIQDTIGWILHLKGDTLSGIEYLRRSFDIAGWDIPVIGLHLAQAEISLGNQDAARSLLNVLAERPEDDPYGERAREILQAL